MAGQAERPSAGRSCPGSVGGRDPSFLPDGMLGVMSKGTWSSGEEDISSEWQVWPEYGRGKKYLRRRGRTPGLRAVTPPGWPPARCSAILPARIVLLDHRQFIGRKPSQKAQSLVPSRRGGSRTIRRVIDGIHVDPATLSTPHNAQTYMVEFGGWGKCQCTPYLIQLGSTQTPFVH